MWQLSVHKDVKLIEPGSTCDDKTGRDGMDITNATHQFTKSELKYIYYYS